ncbi:MAG: fumarylacetoacetate hydrolase family protein [Solirubrobacteraceae bacterium]
MTRASRLTSSSPTPPRTRWPGARACARHDWPAWSPRLSEASLRGEEIDLASVALLPTVPFPPNLYMAGANYREHMREMDGGEEAAAPEGPFIFLRPTTTLVAHGDPIVLPDSGQVDWEADQVDDPDDLEISLTLNGQLERRARTSQMICSVGELIASISAVVPLVPGDIVCTGTPAGVGASGRMGC